MLIKEIIVSQDRSLKFFLFYFHREKRLEPKETLKKRFPIIAQQEIGS